MSAADTILQCGKTLADPVRWCQGALAVTNTGTPVLPKSRGAVRWSLDGIVFAILRVDPEAYDNRRLDEAGECLATIDLCAQFIFKRGMTYVNDVLGHDSALDCLRMAVKRARFNAVHNPRNRGNPP